MPSKIEKDYKYCTFCSNCGQTPYECGCEGSTYRGIAPNDGHRYDQLRFIANSVNGYVLPAPAPATPLFTITAVPDSSTQFRLAPAAPNTMIELDAAFGFTAETEPGDVVFIANLAAPNDVYNSFYVLTAVPSTTAQYYVIRRVNAVPSNGCGLRVGDFIHIDEGEDAVIFQISAISTGPAPKSITVETTSYTGYDYYCIMVAKPPKCC